jgi:hypothetical protein
MILKIIVLSAFQLLSSFHIRVWGAVEGFSFLHQSASLPGAAKGHAGNGNHQDFE